MKDRLNSAECSKYLRGLADPDRLKIVQLLQAGERSVSEICRALDDAALANVSHHLKQLRIAGLVESRKEGRFVLYALAPEFLKRAPRSASGSLNVLDFGCCRIELGKK